MARLSLEAALKIMGENVILPEGASKVLVPDREIYLPKEKPEFTEETLASCQETHILFPVMSISFLSLVQESEEWFIGNPVEPWFSDKSFANCVPACSWHLVARDILEGSTNKPSREQRRMIPKGHSPVKAHVLLQLILLWNALRGEILFAGGTIRTASYINYNQVSSFHRDAPRRQRRMRYYVYLQPLQTEQGLRIGIGYIDPQYPDKRLGIVTKVKPGFSP